MVTLIKIQMITGHTEVTVSFVSNIQHIKYTEH